MRPLARCSVFHFSQFCIIHFCLYMYVYAGLRAHASWNHHLPCAIFFGYDLYVLRSLDYPWDAGYTRLGVWVHSFLLLAKSFYIQRKIPSRRWLLVGKCTRYSRESAHVFAYIGMKSHGVSGLVLGLEADRGWKKFCSSIVYSDAYLPVWHGLDQKTWDWGGNKRIPHYAEYQDAFHVFQTTCICNFK